MATIRKTAGSTKSSTKATAAKVDLPESGGVSMKDWRSARRSGEMLTPLPVGVDCDSNALR